MEGGVSLCTLGAPVTIGNLLDLYIGEAAFVQEFSYFLNGERGVKRIGKESALQRAPARRVGLEQAFQGRVRLRTY
jgi:hypothetical protein